VTLYRRVWRRKSQSEKPVGRPRLAAGKVGLIQRLASENSLWGAERIRGELLLKLGIGVAKSTVQKYTQRIRVWGPQGQNWNTFLRNHASEIWACDFVQTYDALFRTIFVFVIIELESRRVVHFNVTRHPSDAWIAQQWREAAPFGEGPTYLIRDNDRKFGAQFDAATAGMEVLHTPIAAPKANAFCERFVGSLRRECLDYMLILGERHLYRIVKDYVAYFNHARPHQGINQRIPCAGVPVENKGDGIVVGVPILGGLHHDYRRAA
jgi:putative transposase